MTERAARGTRWPVHADEAGVRLDKFLAAPDRLESRGRATTAIARGQVFVNDDEMGAPQAARKLAVGDVVRLWQDRPGSASQRSRPRPVGPLEIIYEDKALLVANKPAGLLAVPLERKSEAPALTDHIEMYLRSRGKRRPLVVHRIDRDTSGLIVVARDPKTEAALKEQFKRHTAERVYLAVVYGRPEPVAGTWRDTLTWDQDALIQKETHPRDPRGKEAISHYRVLEQFAETALIEVRLVTGKRNQIRLQARLRGHTLVGEQRYTFGPDQLRPDPFPRQALHAWKLAFRHPEDGRRLEFEAPLPDDLKALLRRLAKL
jgi:23S rRNA pseudouridine1911/1915/1917 synthase